MPPVSTAQPRARATGASGCGRPRHSPDRGCIQLGPEGLLPRVARRGPTPEPDTVCTGALQPLPWPGMYVEGQVGQQWMCGAWGPRTRWGNRVGPPGRQSSQEALSQALAGDGEGSCLLW